jgi:Fur family ferric uptake transcriptional regulator
LTRLTEIERRCAENKLRMTDQRRAVIRVIAEARDHPDVEELYHRVRTVDATVSLATVYRNVKRLEKMGVLKRHEFTDGRSRYEITPARHHDHLIDVETGCIIEFRSPEIERLQVEIARRHGYQIIDHRLEIYAAPIKCSGKQQSKEKRS